MKAALLCCDHDGFRGGLGVTAGVGPLAPWSKLRLNADRSAQQRKDLVVGEVCTLVK